MKSILLLICLLLACSAFAGEPIDAKDAELQMLRTAVKSASNASEPLRAKVRELTAALASQKRDSEAKEKELGEKIEFLTRQVATVAAERDKLKEIVSPGSSKITASGAPTVTPAQLNTMGERYDGQKVVVADVEFNDVNTIYIHSLPGVTIESNGLMSRINTREAEKWIGFSASSSGRGAYNKLFASKADYGDLLTTMKSRQRISVSGVVVKLDGGSGYGIMCNKIQLASEPKGDQP